MRLLRIMSLMIAFIPANAQDIIVKTNGEEIKAKVEEVSENAIKYRNTSNPTGPLYTISRTSVVSIRYENGYVDEFFAQEAKSEQTITPTAKDSVASDDKLLRMAGNSTNLINPGSMSDADLNRLYTPYKYAEQKAKQLKRTGWIGGTIMGGIGLGICIGGIVGFDNALYGTTIGGACVAGGAIWCISFNLAANNVMKKAREQQFISATLIESEVLSWGQNVRLSASIDMMGNLMSNKHNLGLGLKLNF